MTTWMEGSGAKRTCPVALPFTASAISCALTLMPFRSTVRRGPRFSTVIPEGASGSERLSGSQRMRGEALPIVILGLVPRIHASAGAVQ